MAGATTACVPARAGTILGVTRSIANPAFRRLEQYESLLRLAVPALLGPVSRHARHERVDAGSRWPRGDGPRRHQRYRRHRVPRGHEARAAAGSDGARGPRRRHRPSSRNRMPSVSLAAQPHRSCSAERTARSWRPIRPAAVAPATLARTPRRSAAADGVRRPRRRHDDPARRRRRRASPPCARFPHRGGQIAVVQPLPRVLSGWWARTVGQVSLLGAATVVLLGHRPRLLDAGEPRARGGRGLREGSRPDRFRPQPRPLRALGLGYRPRPDLLVGFHVRAARLRAARRVPVLRRSQCDDPPGRRGSLQPRRAARFRADVPSRPRVPHPQRRRRLDLAARPRRADERPGRRRPVISSASRST